MERHPEQLRDYNQDNLCTACGVHISEGHLPHCVLSDDSAEYDWQPPIEVYVECAKAAEAGKSYGMWIDFTQSRQELQEALTYFLSRSPVDGADQLLMADYSGFWGLEDELSTHSNVYTVHAIAQGIEREGEAMAAWLRCIGATTEDIADQADRFSQHYIGAFDSEQAFAEELIGKIEHKPDAVQRVLIEAVKKGVEFQPSRVSSKVFAFSTTAFSTT